VLKLRLTFAVQSALLGVSTFAPHFVDPEDMNNMLVTNLRKELAVSEVDGL
jgi:hypothetical protein